MSNERQPPDWYNEDRDYFDGDEYHKCTCTDECPPQCTGKCGCKACSTSYSDFLSVDYE